MRAWRPALPGRGSPEEMLGARACGSLTIPHGRALTQWVQTSPLGARASRLAHPPASAGARALGRDPTTPGRGKRAWRPALPGRGSLEEMLGARACGSLTLPHRRELTQYPRRSRHRSRGLPVERLRLARPVPMTAQAGLGLATASCALASVAKRSAAPAPLECPSSGSVHGAASRSSSLKTSSAPSLAVGLSHEHPDSWEQATRPLAKC